MTLTHITMGSAALVYDRVLNRLGRRADQRWYWAGLGMWGLVGLWNLIVLAFLWLSAGR